MMKDKARFIWFTFGFCLVWGSLIFFIYVSYEAYRRVPEVQDLKIIEGVVKNFRCEKSFRRRSPWHVLYLTIAEDVSNKQQQLFVRSRLFNCDGVNQFGREILNRKALIKELNNEMWEVLIPPYPIVDFKSRRDEAVSQKVRNMALFSILLLFSVLPYALALRGYRRRMKSYG